MYKRIFKKSKFLCAAIVTSVISANILVAHAETNVAGGYSQNSSQSAYSSDYHGYAGIHPSGSNQGISATIKTPSSFPDVSDSGESVWVSTDANSDGEWIQAGTRYYYWYTSFTKYVEYFESGVYKIKTDIGTHALNTSVAYKVELNMNDGKWHAYVAGQDCAAGTFPSLTMGVQAHAEIHKEGIQMGPFTFSNVKIKDGNALWKNNTKLPSTTLSGYSVSGTATNFTVSGP